MVNTYFESIPITSEEQARILGSGSGWEILSLLRGNGTYGCTAEEISNARDLPLSTVYNVLANLRGAGFVETRRFKSRLGRPDLDSTEQEQRTGKLKKIYIENIDWGTYQFTEEFDRILVEQQIDRIIDDNEITNVCSDLVDNIISVMKKKPVCKDFLPSTEDCPKCHFSHEAREYAWALVSCILDRILKSKQIDDIMQKHGFTISH